MRVTVNWPGGEHDFMLDIGKLRALQQACDAGPEQIFQRLGNTTWRVDDLFQTIRLGLIGGGVDEQAARDIVTLAFQSHPLKLFCLPARLVLMAALVGDADDPVGEAKGATAPPENGGLAKSTEPARY